MFVITDLSTTLDSKFRMSSYSSLATMAIKLEAKFRFHAASMVLLYVIQKFKKIAVKIKPLAA